MTGSAGWVYCLMNQFDPGFKYIRDYMHIDFQYPKWLHIGTFLYYLSRGDYNNMLIEANMLNTEDLFWGPLLKLISYQMLSQPEKARYHLNELLNFKPDFLDRANEYIACLIKSKDLRRTMLEAVQAVSVSAVV